LSGGFEGSEANNETLFMILEGPMIFIACALLATYHPGRAFGGRLGWVATSIAGSSKNGKSVSSDTLEGFENGHPGEIPSKA
ncbi:hypothetical protein HKX48_000808, partial [Thoreauomyces humboldtii]